MVDARQTREEMISDLLKRGGKLNYRAYEDDRPSDREEARRLIELALKVAEEHYGLEHSRVADCLHDLAYTYWPDHEKQLQLFQRALAIREKTLGPAHETTVHALSMVGGILGGHDRKPEELQLLETQLSRIEAVAEPGNLALRLILVILANFHAHENHLDEAEALLRRAIDVHELAVHPDPHTILVLTQRVAELLEKKGQFEAALTLREKALAISERHHGPEQGMTLMCLNHIAVNLSAQGKLAEAHAIFDKAITISEKISDSMLPYALRDHAALFQKQGKIKEAKSCVERAIAFHKRFVMTEPTASEVRKLQAYLQELSTAP